MLDYLEYLTARVPMLGPFIYVFLAVAIACLAFFLFRRLRFLLCRIRLCLAVRKRKDGIFLRPFWWLQTLRSDCCKLFRAVDDKVYAFRLVPFYKYGQKVVLVSETEWKIEVRIPLQKGEVFFRSKTLPPFDFARHLPPEWKDKTIVPVLLFAPAPLSIFDATRHNEEVHVFDTVHGYCLFTPRAFATFLDNPHKPEQMKPKKSYLN